MVREVICPVCKNSNPWEGNEFRPFCSKACKSRDLGNWAMEKYRIAAEPAETAEDGEKKKPAEE